MNQERLAAAAWRASFGNDAASEAFQPQAQLEPDAVRAWLTAQGFTTDTARYRS